jgi:hypothetical protein
MLHRLTIWALLLTGIVCLLGQQTPTRAYWQTRDSAYNDPVASGPTGPLLDTLSATAIAAYSTRNLRTAYVGNALTAVLAISPFNTHALPFDGGGNLDTSLISSDTNVAHDWSITTWNDQSVGASVGNATAVLAGSSSDELPMFWTSSATVKQNGHACGQWTNGTAIGTDGVIANSSLGMSSSARSQPLTIAMMFKTSTLTSGNFTTDDGSHGVSGQFKATGTASVYGMIAGTGTNPTGGTPDLNAHAGFWIFNTAGASNIFIDGTDVIAGATGLGVNPMFFTGGAQFITFGDMRMLMCEMIIFNGILGAPDQTLIRNSWRAYWGTP